VHCRGKEYATNAYHRQQLANSAAMAKAGSKEASQNETRVPWAVAADIPRELGYLLACEQG
jgi:hypothetical protein